jgi:hypothetical protein
MAAWYHVMRLTCTGCQAISRVKAIDLKLRSWVADEEEAAEHTLFVDACRQCGQAWQTVAVWITDEASAKHGPALGALYSVVPLLRHSGLRFGISGVWGFWYKLQFIAAS